DTLWDDEPAAVARRLNLPLEGKTDRFEGYRAYPRKPLSLLGADAHMVSLQAAEGRITTLTVQFANRGDYPAFQNRDSRMPPSKTELKEFEQALKADFNALTRALAAKLGEPKREIAVGGLDAGRQSLRWEWGPHALLVSHDEEQMVSLKIIPVERATAAHLGDDQVRRLFKERIARRPGGDVVLDQIPMVNQGPKGYCVPATFERYLRYAGIPADMYELAAAGGTDFGGGTSFLAMTRSLDRYVRRQGRRLEKAPLKFGVAGIARYIDEGRPVIWGLYSTREFNLLADANTDARRQIADLARWKPSPSPAELAALAPDPATGHACLIIGYNRTTGEIALSDSWGPGFKERWVPAAAAQKITQDEYWVIAW
ncbi:MAG TPA: C39 family peptidase, partial [Rariglobus sp.]